MPDAYYLTLRDRNELRRALRKVGGGVGRPSKRPLATRRRDRSSGRAVAVAILESISAATGTAGELTPATGESPRYLGQYGEERTYDADITVRWEWYGGAVTVTSGKARMGYVTDGLLIPLCQEFDL